MKKQVTLYTDGACSGNPGIGGYAGILIYGEIRREYNGGELSTTNNRMEVKAVIVGLQKLKYPCKVDVYSDSAYTVNAFANRWIYGWKKNDWKKADGKAVLNIDLWEELFSLVEMHEVVFHTGFEKFNPRSCRARGIEYINIRFEADDFIGSIIFLKQKRYNILTENMNFKPYGVEKR